MNLLDRAIAWFAPGAGLSRARARMAMSAVRSYEAASVSRRTSGWRTTKGDATAEVSTALDRVRERHRDLVRNNPWAKRAVEAIVNNTVGDGIIGLPKSPSGTRARKLERAYKAWAGSADCDYEGRHDFAGLQALVMRTVVEGGEAIIRRRFVDRGPGRIPLALQIIEGDHLDLLKNDARTETGGTIVSGVERNAAGRVVAYWIHPQHPGSGVIPQRLTSERVDASEILHVFRVDRAGQLRGMPWGASVILRLYDLDGYEDAVLLRQKLSACFTAFVHDIEAGDNSSGLPSAATSTTGKAVETLEPGMVEYLPPGKEVTFASPPSAGDSGTFTRDQLRGVAAGYGITYEALTGDLSSTSFSSGRLGWIEFGRNIDAWRWQMLIPQLCAPVGGWFLSAAQLSLGNGIEAGATWDWTPPRRQMIDPTKEVPAIIDAVRGGLISLQSHHREMGLDTAQVFAEQAEDAKAMDEAGLAFDSDGRKPKTASAPAPTPDPANDPADAPVARAITTMGERMAAVTERMGDLFAGMQPPSVSLQPQFHVTVDANKRGAVIREVLETDADGVPTKVVERALDTDTTGA